MPHDYEFIKVTREDYPMLRRWLAQPHVHQWWGAPEAEIAMIEGGVDSGPTDMRIVWFENQPIAYVQDYPAHHWPAPHFAGFACGARSMDTFLGDPALMGQGHARRYLRQRAEQLLEGGCTTILIDPDPTNDRAIATYRNAGFVDVAIRGCGHGEQALVMEFWGADPNTQDLDE